MSVPVPTSDLFLERLYLSKGGDGDIYVNNCGILRENQIDGLRGLYRIFKKKHPGVILNDASDSGKTVLVSLFMESIQSIIDNPVLILCHKDHEIEYWKEIIFKWTRYTEDNIAINSTNPYLKKNVFIQSMDMSNSFFRRCWSVLILKNNEMTKEISKMLFDAEFKIWITSVDVFKDLNLLSSVGKFIDPSLNINTADFEIRNKKLSEKVKTLILLETYTKDFVVRTSHLKSILMKSSDTTVPISNTTTKKNKDATGTKIKRSKRKISDEQPMKCNKKTIKENEIKLNDDNEQDSQSLISFTSPNKSYKLLNTQNSIDDNSKIHEVYQENNHGYDDNVTHMNQNNLLERDVDLLKGEDSIQSLTGIIDNATNDIKTVSRMKSDNIEDIAVSPDDCELQNDVISNHDLSNSTVNIKSTSNVVADEVNTEKEMYDKETIDLNDDTSQIKLNYTEDVNMESDDDKVNTKSECEIVNSEHNMNVISNEIEMANGIKIPNSIPNTQRTEHVENSIDKKLNDLEIKTLMKFKGSFLDSIF